MIDDRKDCFGWDVSSHEDRPAVTICYSRWTRYPGNCIKAVGAFAIESRGLFKQRSQREQCCYHLSAGKITWLCWAELSFWQLYRELIQTMSCLGKTLTQGVWREHWFSCLIFIFTKGRVSAHSDSQPGAPYKWGKIKIERKMKAHWAYVSFSN